MHPLAMLFVLFLLLTPGIATASSDTVGNPPTVPTVFARGASTPPTNGLFFDGEDRLLVASALGRQLLTLDPQSGRVLDRLDPANGVETPDDLAIADDGTLYWTGFLVGEVGRRTPDGQVRSQFVAPGVNPITISDDGRLFTSQCFLGSTLFELDPDLLAPPRVVATDLGPGCGLNGMDFGPDGFLYGPRIFLGDVVRVDPDNGAVTTVAGGLRLPAAVKFDAAGLLYVAEAGTGEVVRVDPATGQQETYARLAPGLDNLAFDSRGRLYVSNFTNGAIVEVLPGGAVRPVTRSGVTVPGGVAVVAAPDSGESVYVADVLALTELDGRSGRTVGIARGVGVSPVINPFTVADAGDGRLLLTSWFDNAVQLWEPATGTALATFFDFAAPLDGIVFQGDLVISELATGNVVRANGAAPAQRTVLAAGLPVAAGLAATDDDLWVAVAGSGQVLQLVDGGSVLATPRLVASGLVFPEGLAVDRDGSLLVVEAGAGRLSRLDPVTGARSTVAENLELGLAPPPGFPPTWIFNGVAVGEGGIYVSAEGANVLYRFPATGGR